MPIDPVTSPSGATTATDATVAKVAAGFEELLLRQLAQSLADTTGADASSDDGATGGSGSDATTSLLRSFLPDALAESATAAGGLGLAASIESSLEGVGR